MRFPFPVPSRARLKRFPLSLRKSLPSQSSTSHTLPDILRTSLLALRESADACPPLKSAVGGVVALWDIAEVGTSRRAKHAKRDARDIAFRTNEIMENIGDAVPDVSKISPPLLAKIVDLALLLEDIRRDMEIITSTGGIVRVARLNRNERVLQDIRVKLDEKTHDFATGSLLRQEIQQAQMAVEQTQFISQHKETHYEVKKIVDTMHTFASEIALVRTYCVFILFFGSSLMHQDAPARDGRARVAMHPSHLARGAASQGLPRGLSLYFHFTSRERHP
ncbi:hypothetical protein DFH08DRAFT_939916, partial [Mycena albidolilacea]